jgi:hypothetical protein
MLALVDEKSRAFTTHTRTHANLSSLRSCTYCVAEKHSSIPSIFPSAIDKIYHWEKKSIRKVGEREKKG